MTAAAPDAQLSPAKASASGLKKFFALDLLDNRYASLHGLRVLAILAVVQYHVTWIFVAEQGIPLAPEFYDPSLTLFFGMDLFFMLSGFLIGSILLRSLQVSGTQNLKRFYIRRIFRTFPSYYVVLTALAVATTLTPEQKSNLFWEYVYGSNFLPRLPTDTVMFWGWSLALEEQFYLGVPVLFFVLHRLTTDRARLWLLGLLWAGCLTIRLYIYFKYRPWNDFALYDAVYFRLSTRYDTLIAGIILAIVHQKHGARVKEWLEKPFHKGILGVVALACLWLLLRPTMFGRRETQLVHIFAWGTVTTIMYFCVLTLLLHDTGFISKVLGAPIFRKTATLGYGVYLVHIPLIYRVVVPAARSLQKAGHSMAWVYPASLTAVMAMSFAIAYVLHILIEKPSLKLREMLGS